MKNSIVKSFIWLITVGLIATATYWYIQQKQLFPSTEDAYVEANTIQVAAQINGQVMHVFTKDHARVSQSDALLEIDPTPYQIAYNQAEANLQAIQENIQAGMSGINAAQAMISQQKTSVDLAKKTLARTLQLAKKNMGAKAEEDKAKAAYNSAKDALTVARSKWEEAKQTVGADDQSNAKLRMAQAQLARAKWNLDNTKIKAPSSGIVSHFNSRKGDTVTQGYPLFTLVEDNHYWINANFKETSLENLRVGESVKITIDMYPKKSFHGVIESISPTSGSSMSLLPSENASGNWVKVTQRFPVRISITDAKDSNYPLLIGASAKVTVDTTEDKNNADDKA